MEAPVHRGFFMLSLGKMLNDECCMHNSSAAAKEMPCGKIFDDAALPNVLHYEK
jgi:hypothetical protein